jgi:hypothetical protein
MNNNVMVAAILVLVGIVGISSNTFANPSENMNKRRISRITEKDCSDTPYKPEAFYGFAQTAPTKSEALELLKKAEECYVKKGDQAGAEKVQNQIAHIDTINFAQNRRELIDVWRMSAEDSRQQGKSDEAAKYEAWIREIEQAKE